MYKLTRYCAALLLLAVATVVAAPADAQTAPRTPGNTDSGGEIAVATLLDAAGETSGRMAAWERMLPEGLQRGVDVSVRDLEPNATYTVLVDGTSALLPDSIEVVTFTTDENGHARLRLRSPGDEFPPVPDEMPAPSDLTAATVIDELGNEVLAGEFTRRPGRRVQVRGVVGELGVDSFVLVHGDRSVTVLVDGNTDWRGGLTGFGDLELEMPVAVAGRLTEDGSVLAAVVSAWVHPPARVRGEVTTVGADGFDVMRADGSLTSVLVDEDTVWRGGLTGLGDLSAGDLVLAVGQWNPDGALLAATVASWRGPEPPPRVLGDVLALQADGFELGLDDGQTITVLVNEETAWRGGIDGLEDLEVGDRVIVVGERPETEDGTLLAVLVALWHEPVAPARVRGEVVVVLADGFEVLGEDGAVVTVVVDESTAWRGLDGLEDLSAGDQVIAAGEWGDDGTLLARLVSLQRPRPVVVHGDVLQVLADGFELQVRDGSAVQVQVDDDTVWRGGLGGLTDVEVGMTLVVSGHRTGEATLLARHVAPWRGPGQGEAP